MGFEPISSRDGTTSTEMRYFCPDSILATKGEFYRSFDCPPLNCNLLVHLLHCNLVSSSFRKLLPENQKRSLLTVLDLPYLGCLMGFEPTTSSSTGKRSAIELQAPYKVVKSLSSTVTCSAIELQAPYLKRTTFYH
jgi:hypothetical protein